MSLNLVAAISEGKSAPLANEIPVKMREKALPPPTEGAEGE
jgi:hypothetical protein